MSIHNANGSTVPAETTAHATWAFTAGPSMIKVVQRNISKIGSVRGLKVTTNTDVVSGKKLRLTVDVEGPQSIVDRVGARLENACVTIR
jgi:hypothetical protein